MLSFITEPLLRVLVALYSVFGNFGWAIVVFTIILRLALVPFSLPLMKSQKKMRELKPHLDALKKKHGNDRKKMQEEQLKLYQQHNVNPAAGCLPYLLQIVVLIALYQVLNTFLTSKEVFGVPVRTQFYWLDLAQPDQSRIFPILAGITQLFLSVMLLPGLESHDLYPEKSQSKKIQESNKKESDAQEMAESIQKQTLFIMPFFTVFISLKFPSGLAMYWVVSTIFSIVQQWVISGPGGLAVYAKQVVDRVKGRKV